VDLRSQTGNGFKFLDLSAESVFGALRRAVAAYADVSTLAGILRRAMEQEFSHRIAARQYHELYRRLVGERGRG
jgi:glycogen synthase